jgi:hypothetical protein
MLMDARQLTAAMVHGFTVNMKLVEHGFRAGNLDSTPEMRHNLTNDMTASAISEIESQFAQLPPDVQLSVLERLVHQMRANLPAQESAWEAGLSAMAADPELQKELGRINSEFRVTEADGLGRT